MKKYLTLYLHVLISSVTFKIELKIDFVYSHTRLVLIKMHFKYFIFRMYFIICTLNGPEIYFILL